jgi:SAM-dependent methyltransferase
MSGQPWDASYQPGPAPWDIGKPQPAVVRLASEGRLVGPVLDAGCGSGENALHVASLGHAVIGVDVAETALTMAHEKAVARGIVCDFAFGDAFELTRLGRTFETVLDCGLFHTFDAVERLRYVSNLAAVTKPNAMLYVLCFSDEGPGTGPHPIRQQDLQAAFTDDAGWKVETIQQERVLTRFHDEHGAPAWLATIRRI